MQQTSACQPDADHQGKRCGNRENAGQALRSAPLSLRGNRLNRLDKEAVVDPAHRVKQILRAPVCLLFHSGIPSSSNRFFSSPRIRCRMTLTFACDSPDEAASAATDTPKK